MGSSDKKKTATGITLIVLIVIVAVFFVVTKDTRQLSLAEAKLKDGNYQEAINLAKEVQNSNLKDQVETIIAKAVLAMAEETNSQGKYEESLKILESSRLANGSSESSEEVRKAILSIYDQLINMSVEKGDYQEAVRLLKNEMDYTPDNLDSINKKMLQIYQKKLESLISSKFYLDALDFINGTMANYEKYDSEDSIKTQKRVVLDLLATDTGIDGKKAIEKVGKAVCSGKNIDTDLLPLISTDNTRGKAYICSSKISELFPLTDPAKAQSLSELKYFVKDEEKRGDVKPCRYNDGYTLEITQTGVDIILFEIKTGISYKNKTLFGSYSCPTMWSFTIGDFTDTSESLPEDSVIHDFIQNSLQ